MSHPAHAPRPHGPFTITPILNIPASSLRELRCVFLDTAGVGAEDYPPRGLASEPGLFLTRAEVSLALSKASAHLSPDDLASLLDAMDPHAVDAIPFAPFAGGVHALSVQHKEVASRVVYAVFPDSTLAPRDSTALLRCRRSGWRLLDDPGSSVWARLLAIGIMVLIFISTLAFLLETSHDLAAADQAGPNAFKGVEVAAVAGFTVEFIARLACTPNYFEFVTTFLNWVDFFSVAPFYIELAAGLAGGGTPSSGVVRAARLTRLFRLLKVSRYVSWIRVFTDTLAASGPALAMVALLTTLATTAAASTEWFLERGDAVGTTASGAGGAFVSDGNGSYVSAPGEMWFESIPSALWWAVVSATGVGYGDTIPMTVAGKLSAVALFFAGIILLAIPISVISANFHNQYGSMRAMRALRALHARRAAAGMGGGALPARSGELSDEEEEEEDEPPTTPSKGGGWWSRTPETTPERPSRPVDPPADAPPPPTTTPTPTGPSRFSIPR